jgi:DNA-binding transcriptional LysR family regulator
MDMKITLRQLEVFAAVARAENVTRAAEALAMSQSAASSSTARCSTASANHCT